MDEREKDTLLQFLVWLDMNNYYIGKYNPNYSGFPYLEFTDHEAEEWIDKYSDERDIDA